MDLLNAAAQDRRLQAGELVGAWMEVRALREDGGLRTERLRAGDLVTFTRQVYFGPGQRRVENGASGTLVRVHSDADSVDVRLPDRIVTIRGDQLTALRLGYAQHVYNAQGRTVDRTYFVTGGWQTAREGSYVGVGRAREASFVYSDHSSLDQEVHNRKAALRDLIARVAASRAKVSAIGWREHRAQALERSAGDATREQTARPPRRPGHGRPAGPTAVPSSNDPRADAARREVEQRREAAEQRRHWEMQRD